MPSKVTVVWSCWKGLSGHRNSFVLCVTSNCIMWMLCRAGIVSLLEVGRYLISVVDLRASFFNFLFEFCTMKRGGRGGGGLLYIISWFYGLFKSSTVIVGKLFIYTFPSLGKFPFSNPDGGAWALPVCHKWPTSRKNPTTKWEVASQHLGYVYNENIKKKKNLYMYNLDVG